MAMYHLIVYRKSANLRLFLILWQKSLLRFLNMILLLLLLVRAILSGNLFPSTLLVLHDLVRRALGAVDLPSSSS